MDTPPAVLQRERTDFSEQDRCAPGAGAGLVCSPGNRSATVEGRGGREPSPFRPADKEDVAARLHVEGTLQDQAR